MADPESIEEIDEAALAFMDVRSDEFSRYPHRVIQKFHQRGPLARSHRGIEVLSHDLCNAVLVNSAFETLGAAHFRGKGAPGSLISFVDHGILLNMEGDRHDRIRRVMARAFSIRQVEQQRQMMRRTAVRLLEPLLATGRCDLVSDFTERYPMEVLCQLIGVSSEDIPTFHGAAIDLHLMGAVPLAPGFPRLDEALRILWKYVFELVEKRRTEPAEDLVSALIEAQSQRARLTDEEVVWSIVNLLFAGQDTTRFQLASAVRAFVSVPDLWRTLGDDPSLIPAALEEALRLRPVAQFIVRQATDAAEAGGLRFPPNRRVVLNLLAASRDPSTFPAPDAFRLDRSTAYRLPFGWGRHYCLGHALARSEMCEALVVLTRCLTNPVVEPGVVDAPAAAMLGGPEKLPISFAPSR